MPTTRRLRHATVAATALSAAASWAVVTQVAGVHLGVRFPHSSATTVALGTIVAAAAGATLLGWGLLAVLETMTSHARRVWATVAVAVFLVSLALPIAFATTTAAAAGLAAIHLAVASVAITGLSLATSYPRRASSPAADPARPDRPAIVPRPSRRYRPSRRILMAGVASVVLGGTVAVLAGTSSAEVTPSGKTGTRATSTPVPMGAFPWSSGPGWAASGPGWAASGPGRWMSRAARSAGVEYFHVASTDSEGPGAIIVTGVVDAGGAEHPGRAIDGATFAGGGFRIDHSVGHPTIAFDPKTCVGTIDQTGPFSIIDGTGRFAALAGSGNYVFHAIYTTARGAGGCTEVMTAYLENIDGALTLSPSAARSLAAAAG